MNGTVFGVCASLALVWSPQCGADDPKSTADGAAIEKVVEASLKATGAADWKGYSELVHPDSLQQFKAMWLPILQRAAKDAPGEQTELLSLFEKGNDLKSLIAMKPKEFFVSAMKGLTSKAAKVNVRAPTGDSKIIGTVREGSELAHLVIRSRVGNTESTKVEVVTVKRTGLDWRLMLPDAIQAMAEAFQRLLEVGA
jgi:hypothetical protein